MSRSHRLPGPARIRRLRLSLVELERRDVPTGGPLGPLQPADLGPVTYSTNAAGLPLLTGLSTARAAIFLDFDGHVGNGIDDAPYDTDGDPTTFNASALRDPQGNVIGAIGTFAHGQELLPCLNVHDTEHVADNLLDLS